ncbi:hypothetical protein [Bradyrhizobium japonicum]|uniref:hypothetical protein n=1 Tax=Bradyrhizobium japonicum TaxID=375 RepID=UPI0027152350|nr:hypothetical protein [Bradyrhizobium japonicum]WLB24191.1 hypothetical protein QIH95_47295 [Bradyrhizobium japonicum]
MTISTKRFSPGIARCVALAAALLLAASAAPAASPADAPLPETSRQYLTHPAKDLMKMAQNSTPPGAAEMAAAKTITMKVLAIGTWTAKATPETRPAIMRSEARDTMRLMLAGKIDQWFAKTDGSGAVFLMNVTDPKEAHTLLEDLPLGRADMMTFDLIPVGPLWPLGLLLGDPAK